MLLVVVESPFRGKTPVEERRNIEYAQAAVRDCLLRGEAPIASHLLHTQVGILNDEVPRERELGMAAGRAWIPKAHKVVVYTDFGISLGMKAAINLALDASVPVVERTLPIAVAALTRKYPPS